MKVLNLPIAVPSGRVLALAALVVPVACVLTFRAHNMRNIASYSSAQHPTTKASAQSSSAKKKKKRNNTTATTTPQNPPPPPHSLPSQDDLSTNTLWHERLASRPISPPELGPHAEPPLDTTALLTTYVRATMRAFTTTPQATLLRRALPRSAADTLETSHIDALDFAHEGQRVGGVYVVSYRGAGPDGRGERVEMRLSRPEGYEGPGGEGVIVAAVEPVGGEDGEGGVVFANETWLWRGEDEGPTFLEFAVGRWMHSLLAAWLIQRGLDAVQRG